MNFVDGIEIGGVPAFQIPSIKGQGAPTAVTEGAVGCFYMDIDTGNMYKCTAVEDGVYTWDAFGDGGGGSVAETDEKYFYITDDGLISLKDEYRGVGRSDYKYSVSNNGENAPGSQMEELPEVIVIPEVVNEIAVTAFAPAMFYGNTAIQKITLPRSLKEIPERFCEGAANLREVNGTENVEVIYKGAFQYSGIEKAYFPMLKNFAGEFVFSRCPLLTVADIGEVTSIPRRTFMVCEKLSAVRTSGKITSVGIEAFPYTRRLKNLSFLPNLTSIEDAAFIGSRVIFDWSTLTGCTFGTNATPLQYNPTDYWSSCTFTPCKTELRASSNFDQDDPRWADKNIGDTELTYGDNGCNAVSSATVYAVFEQKDLKSPEDFVEAVRLANPDLMSLPINQSNNLKLWWEALGYRVDQYKGGSAADVQAMYDALAQGDLIIASNVIPTGETSGHSVVIHGITESGELMALDNSPAFEEIGIYGTLPFTSRYQNFIVQGFTIIRKPTQSAT